ncbi:UNVERIFIED_CONTAM: hypothetical protein NCL1_19478 [Trichonephila clavipes]
MKGISSCRYGITPRFMLPVIISFKLVVSSFERLHCLQSTSRTAFIHERSGVMKTRPRLEDTAERIDKYLDDC